MKQSQTKIWDAFGRWKLLTKGVFFDFIEVRKLCLLLFPETFGTENP